MAPQSPSPSPTRERAQPFLYDLAVYNSAGERVRSLVQGGRLQSYPDDFKLLQAQAVPELSQSALILAGGQVFSFNGANDSGQALASGAYFVQLSVIDSFGAVSSYSAQVTLLHASGSSRLCVANAAGEWVRCFDLGPPGGVRGEGVLSDRAFTPGAGSKVSLKFDNASASWDGLDSSGRQVSSGIYTLMLSSESQGGARVKTWQVQVLAAPTEALRAQAWPNPWRPEIGPLRISYSGGDAELTLHNAAGERVASAMGQGGKATLTQIKAASGVYLLLVRMPGQIDSIKIAILR